uniref:Uncharacterized protein n=1 Tax=Mycena chlorophos TaxID=658473 RepID=A0ABQ0KZT0_MYCCL|nr:predicted protein [Mycena chlorophos]
MNVHPPVPELRRAVHLDIVDLLAQTVLDGAMQDSPEPRCTTGAQSQTANDRNGNTTAPFSLKSFNPASCPSSNEAAGNHPIIVLEDATSGGFSRNDNAKAGMREENGVGGSMRW